MRKGISELKLNFDINSLVFLCSILIMGVYFVPFLSDVFPTIVIFCIVLIAYFLIFLDTHWNNFVNIKYYVGFLIVLFLFWLFDDRYKDGIPGFYSLLLCFYPVACTFYFFSKKQFLLLSKISYFILISIAITAITTYYGLITNPELSRILATGQDDNAIAISLSGNIGGFSFIYSFALSMPFYMWGIEYKVRSKIFRAFLKCVISCLCLFTLLKAQYTIALFLWIVSLIFSLFIKKVSLTKLIFLNVAFLILVMLFDEQIALILRSIADNINSEIIAQRFLEMADAIAGNIYDSSDLSLRTNYYRQSLETFLHYPIFGAWYCNGETGGHSLLLDLFAKGGIVFAGYILYFFIRTIRHYFINSKTKNKNYYIIFLFTVFLMSIFNPISGGSFIALIFTLPIGLLCTKVEYNHFTHIEKKCHRKKYSVKGFV